MMGEIVNDSDALNLSANLATAADALERCQRGGDGLEFNSPCIGGNDHRQTVAHVEIADQRRLKLGPFFSLTKDTKASHLFSIRNIARLPTGVCTRPKGFQLREQLRPHGCDYVAHVRAVPTGD